MKLKIATIALLIGASAHAQTVYDAAQLTPQDLNGTARFVGMGGALGALGGDISTMGTNPAGIGLMRRADVTFTAGFDQTKAELGGQSENRTRARLNNVGVVLPFDMSFYGNSLKSVNIGINYQRRSNLYQNMQLDGLNLSPRVSQTTQMSSGVGELNDWGNFLTQKMPLFMNYDVASSRTGYFKSTREGGIDQTDVSLAFNVDDRFYFGITAGLYDVDYTNYTDYGEDAVDGNNSVWGYTLHSDNWIHGQGVDFKLGFIARPFEESPFRIGLAVHSPIFYNLTYSASSFLDYREESTSQWKTVSDDGGYDSDFKLRTPWLFNVSAGYTIGKSVALGAEYEYQDFSTCNLADADGNEYRFDNNQIESYLKAIQTFRVGAEFKLMPELALRLGYNYSSAGYNKGGYKDLSQNTMQTNTDFTNRYAQNTFTMGIGVKLTSNFYMDLAYKYTTQDGDFYAFDSEKLQSTKFTETRNSFLCTLGYKF
ncbi:MAG: TonB-dependent receptor [Bacteroidaceae bacterium]|nr:TonB-dependent receptor [Bacteroidaceae bacterium]